MENEIWNKLSLKFEKKPKKDALSYIVALIGLICG